MFRFTAYCFTNEDANCKHAIQRSVHPSYNAVVRVNNPSERAISCLWFLCNCVSSYFVKRVFLNFLRGV
uniref:Uncharacterized protein n=1 Tax=Anguilla anguilla TaxID=7936 RepID=A0A0E9REW4_ANGAN